MNALSAGFLNVNKPEGLTSRDVVNRIQWLLKRKTGQRKVKVGHCGTLDPMATGVLVVGVGSATRLTSFVQQQRKSYLGRFELGRSTNTDDVTGEVISEDFVAASQVAEEDIREILPKFKGTISQVPPKFSAVHIDGKRAYELARKGEDVEISAREVEVYSISLIRFSEAEGDSPPEFDLAIDCGSGTYIRSIGRDIGQRLGCGATMSALTRTAIGPFRISEAAALESFDEDNVLELVQPSVLAIPEMPQRILTPDELALVSNGRTIPLGEVSRDAEQIALLTQTGDVAAIAIPGRIRGTLQPDLVLRQ